MKSEDLPESSAQEVNSLSNAELAQMARFLTPGTRRILTNSAIGQASLLPSVTRETHEQVAFQSVYGTPWRLIGPYGGSFKWSSADKGKVSDESKEQIRELLQSYAKDNSISLRGERYVRLALRRGEYWVSFAGGVSYHTNIATA